MPPIPAGANANVLDVTHTAVLAAPSSPTFGVSHDRFVVDGMPIAIRSGEYHYFRSHPDSWSEGLARLRALGLNAVTTYVPWNVHEPQPGALDFGSNLLPGELLDHA